MTLECSSVKPVVNRNVKHDYNRKFENILKTVLLSLLMRIHR